ncbi:MAG: hypothetical protein CL841_04730 [Crocinitomicaceae bacterium]|nr:hypothetical protein [Crocinitomicaceae bacterium]|tara:strand:- start:798 stop:3629 length:2832 start_codon:yes stop_codon:yes gene_type:complete
MKNRIKILFIIAFVGLFISPFSSQKINFVNTEIEFYRGQIVSNILKITNTDSIELLFKVSISHPEKWKILGDKFKVYSLSPSDSLFLPVRIVPLGKIKGNTKYIISGYIFDIKTNEPIISTSFYVKKPKYSNWEVKAEPASKLYLKNGESNINFGFNVRNIGTEEENVNLEIYTNNFNNIVITDTNRSPLKSFTSYFSLGPSEDTTSYYSANLTESIRNFRRRDINNFNLDNKLIKYQIFSKSGQSILSNVKTKRSAIVQILHLPNSIKENPYPKLTLPVTVDANFNNLLSLNPTLSLFFNGRTTLPNQARLIYNTQAFLSTSYRPSFESLFFNIGYFTNNYSIKIGNVGGGLGYGGRGLSAGYRFSNKLSVGTYFSFTPRVFQSNFFTAGLSSSFKANNNLFLMGNYAHSFGLQGLNSADFFKASINYSFLKNHSIHFTPVMVRTQSALQPNASVLTFNLNGGYRVNYLNNKATTNLNVTSNMGNSGTFGLLASSNRFFSHMTNFRISEKWNISLQNSYQDRDSLSAQMPRMVNLINRINFNGHINNKPFRPSIFYNYTQYAFNSFINRGFMYTASTSDFQKNTLFTFNFQAGFKKKLNDPRSIDRFFFLSYFLYRYRVWTVNLRYGYGSISVFDLINSVSPLNNTQSLALTLNHQYQFKNPKWVLENITTYRTERTNNRNSITIVPQLYHLTKNELRLSVSPGLFWNSIKENNSEYPTKTNTSFMLNFALKKKIGIPVPKAKKLYTTTKFCAFVDNNGNHKKDENESLLENIVISLGYNELLTNINGEATMYNLFKDSIYDLSIFSIDNLEGFFPYYESKYYPFKDSVLLIPFVKGVNVYGEIYIDRDKSPGGFDLDYDLSKIRVSAYNGQDVHTLTNVNGKFSMYVPYGEYVISLDNDVIGTRFRILENDIKLNLDEGTESVFITFYLVEKRRKITIKKF